MSSPDLSVPVFVQQRLIGANLNSTMLLNFLMGIYTMVYGGTMYLYLFKKPANTNGRIVLSAISALYILCLLDFILQWYLLNLAIVIDGDTRESIFLGTLEGGPVGILVLLTFLINFMLLIADGLLIWRCYHVSGQSLWVIAFPSILFIAEFGLAITEMVLEVLLTQVTSNINVNLFNHISSALSFISLGTTFTTTFLIGHKIHFTSRLNGPPSKKLFNHIVVVILESAAAYSLVLLFDALIVVVPVFADVGSSLNEAQYYIGAVSSVVSGMAPTVLVARIALINPNTTVNLTTTTHISCLKFDSQQRDTDINSENATNGIINSPIKDDAEPTHIPELKSCQSRNDRTFEVSQA